MHGVTIICMLVIFPSIVLTRRSFPTGTDRYTEKLFREINPRIRWDDSNYLVDEAGPYAVCRNQGINGVLPITLKADYTGKYGRNGVGGLVQGIEASGTTVSYVRKDIETIIRGWVKRYPYIRQIEAGTIFGCSVEPGCPSGRGRKQTVVACLFSPGASGGNNGNQGDRSENIIEIKAVAYTDEEYRITEHVLRSINPNIKWDRSHFLENLSGSQTSCNMVGTSRWDVSKALTVAEQHKGYRPYFIYGSTPRNGNTDSAIRDITQGWLKREGQKLARAVQVGCSLAIGCRGRSDILVASCLIKPR